MNSTPWVNIPFQQLQQSDSWTLALVALLATTLLATYTFRNHDDNQKRPPLVSYKYPFIGNTFDYNRDPDGFVRDAHAKYGPTFRIYIKGRVQTIVSSKEHMKKVLTSHHELDFGSAIMDDFRMERAIEVSDAKGLHVEKIVSNYIVSQLKEYTPRVVGQLEKGLQIYMGDFGGQKIIDEPIEMINYIVARASASIFVGEELCEDSELIESFRLLTSDIATQMLSPGPIQLFPRLSHIYQYIYFKIFAPKSKHMAVIRRVVLPIIDKRRREKAELGDKWQKPIDVLQDLIDQEDLDTFDNNRIFGSLFVLIFTSIHTTTESANAVLYRIANYPQYMLELREELTSVLEDPEENDYLTSGMVKKLVMLDSFVRETFRLGQDPIRLQHKNITGKTLDLGNDVIIPAGGHVAINELASRLDEDSPNPEIFDPWRFVGKGKNATRIGTGYLAFGMGKHACPGRFLAVQEIKMAITTFISRYDFEVVEKGIGNSKKGPIRFTKIR